MDMPNTPDVATAFAMQFTRNHYAIYKNFLRRDLGLVLALSTAQCHDGVFSNAVLMESRLLMRFDPFEAMELITAGVGSKDCGRPTAAAATRPAIDICTMQHDVTVPPSFATIKRCFLSFQSALHAVLDVFRTAPKIEPDALIRLAAREAGMNATDVGRA